MYMAPGMDDGNIIKQESIKIENTDNINKRWNMEKNKSIRTNTNVYDGIRTYTNATNTNTNTNTNKDKDTNKESSETDVPSLPFFLIRHLNEKTGSNYKVTNWLVDRVENLLAAGYTNMDLFGVIDRKCAEWLGDEKMRTYLRPSTLFGDKFGEYLAAPISIAAERQQKADEDRAALERTLTEKRQTLSVLKESLSGADKTERRQLREQIAILEDSIGLIEKRIGGVA